MTKQDVEITIHETKLLFTNCDYPEPTREQIADKLKDIIFSYSEKRMPLSMEDVVEISHEDFEHKHLNLPTARITELRNVSSSVHGAYNANHDPFNED